jgi:uncharacterized protein
MIRQFAPAAVLTAVALVVALVVGGPQDLVIVAILGVLEISLSFDNAVVNAKVLTRMHPVWQQLFLTVGILIAVFGMRLVLPVFIVAVTAHVSVPDVVNLALNEPAKYGRALAHAKEAIYAFGGTFLFMIFLDFVFDVEREIHWLKPVERALARVGKLDQLSVVVALGGIGFMSAITTEDKSKTVLIAGLMGLGAYLIINALDNLFEAGMEDDDASAGTEGMTGAVFKAGVFTFLYLEVLDASFSFDGVIGAFAISDKIFVIALGLGVGAFWIRSLTLYLVRKGTLAEYVYLDHGAHWAIGALAVIMLLQVHYEVPEVVTGLIGVGFIGLALVSSIIERKKVAGRPEGDDRLVPDIAA